MQSRQQALRAYCPDIYIYCERLQLALSRFTPKHIQQVVCSRIVVVVVVVVEAGHLTLPASTLPGLLQVGMHAHSGHIKLLFKGSELLEQRLQFRIARQKFHVVSLSCTMLVDSILHFKLNHWLIRRDRDFLDLGRSLGHE